MRCGCGGEGFDRTELRVIRSDDLAEVILDGCEEATGTRPAGCPWRAFADPFVAEVVSAHRWFAKSQLETRYGGSVPAAIIWGCEVYDAALNAVQVTDIRADREKREAEAREREKNRQR